MTPILENAQLSTDLDCRNLGLFNILHFYPVPPGLVPLTDPGLSDQRPMLDGSVTDESVANDAGILQSKLNLNGVMPPAWFGPMPDINEPGLPRYAARGDLAEMIARKGALNGYAPVDVNLKLLPEHVTPGAGPGTVSEIGFSFPDTFNLSSLVADSIVTCDVTWKNVPDNSWFGIYSVGLASEPKPGFHMDQLPMEFIPSVSASKFTSGTFKVEVLPVAQGMGTDHAGGIVPDPGDTGDPNEYLGRDMEYHHFDAHHFYQPFVPDPTITLISVQDDMATVTLRSALQGSVLFYRFDRPDFLEAPPSGSDIHITVQVPRGTVVEGYASKQGYNNSKIASYTVPLADIII